ncbi:hypothetical protein [Granulosicoccus antarcticus]|nr:hypothetical protein [Granulosicoccus antarcticus]
MSRQLASSSIFYPALRIVGLALPAACLFWNSVPVAFAQQGLQVREQNGMLSVQANNATASELAQLLSDQLGISVVVTGDTEARVNIDIIDEPLDKALAKLSPNHLLVREDKQPDSAITEVVLMMGEGSASDSSGGDEQFLPSGSPADDIVIDEAQATEEAVPTRDPNRSAAVREAADAASSDAAGMTPENSGGSPPPSAFDPVSGLPVDPLTGQPLE